MVDLTSSACLIVTQHILLPCYYSANIFGGGGISLLTRINFINSNVSKRIGYQSNFASPGGGNAIALPQYQRDSSYNRYASFALQD
jgi:hypothetical protein